MKTPSPALAGALRLLKLRKAAHAADKTARMEPLRADVAAATVLLGAALGRVPGLIDQLFAGPPLVVVVEVPDGKWADAMAKAGRICFRPILRTSTALLDGVPLKRQKAVVEPYAVYVYGSTEAHSSPDGLVSATSAIADMHSVIGIAGSPRKELSDVINRAADHRIVSGPLDSGLLALVVTAVAGSRPRKRLDAHLLRRLDLVDLRLAVHRDRGPDGCIDRLDRLLRSRGKAVDERPKLEDLRGYGAAGEWGLALAQDIQAFVRSEIRAADLPKGCVFWGPSGVGKTYLASAIAAQAGVPLVTGSLGRWQSVGEAHMGTTCKAMRQFFTDARALAPCIAFVDELDSFGDRSRFKDGNRDYSSQIVNNFLECLDGAEHRDGVVLLGATNLPGRIDPAITRSGRFDRMIEITLPSKADLEAILRFHLGTDLPDADLDEVARRCIGGTGADCAALVRRAGSRARRRGRPLELGDLLAETDVGLEPNPETVRRTAVHEAGHALVGHALGLELGDISLRRTLAGGRGSTHVAPPEIATLENCRKVITVAMAGRAAEVLVFGNASAGASADLETATAIAADTHFRWGLGTTLVVDTSPSDARFRELVESDLRRAFAEASAILSCRRPALLALADAVVDRRAMTGPEIVGLLGPQIDALSLVVP